jgi:hypothetical protein
MLHFEVACRLDDHVVFWYATTTTTHGLEGSLALTVSADLPNHVASVNAVQSGPTQKKKIARSFRPDSPPEGDDEATTLLL